MAGVSIVTGVARHSFGASFVRAHLEGARNSRLIGLDRISNPDFSKHPNFHEVICDLNPLTFPGGYNAFVRTLADRLSSASSFFGGDPIRCLVQFAGTYEFGPFTGHDINRRQRILGLNLLGITEVLHAVMTLNALLRKNNGKEFIHVLAGSFQGLKMRAERSLYAASKAYGLDLCAALAKGGELSKCLYLAIGPMDTAMLHWNHWTAKLGGSNRFFQSIFAGDPSVYRSVFIECNDDALATAAEPAFSSDLVALKATFKNYKDVRKNAFHSELGVLEPNRCAKLLDRLLESENLESGVYALTAAGDKIVVKMARFAPLDRAKLFESSADTLPLEV
jgi:hypothetical protein